jgi:hypothetical protein
MSLATLTPPRTSTAAPTARPLSEVAAMRDLFLDERRDPDELARRSLFTPRPMRVGPSELARFAGLLGGDVS